MECQRCQGLMVQDRLYDLQDTHIHCDVWRCICCGDIFDTQILLHKRNWPLQLQPTKIGVSIEQLAAA